MAHLAQLPSIKFVHLSSLTHVNRSYRPKLFFAKFYGVSSKHCWSMSINLYFANISPTDEQDASICRFLWLRATSRTMPVRAPHFWHLFGQSFYVQVSSVEQPIENAFLDESLHTILTPASSCSWLNPLNRPTVPWVFPVLATCRITTSVRLAIYFFSGNDSWILMFHINIYVTLLRLWLTWSVFHFTMHMWQRWMLGEHTVTNPKNDGEINHQRLIWIPHQIWWVSTVQLYGSLCLLTNLLGVTRRRIRAVS